MHAQPHINDSMRTILIDWMIQVHSGLHSNSRNQTLHLAVYLLDRYLSVQTVCRNRLQLVGVTALLIASKYEDVCALKVKHCVHLCDNAYNTPDVCAMEGAILRALDFRVVAPTVAAFLDRYLLCMRANESSSVQNLAEYFADCTLLDYKILCYRPSLVAASALAAACIGAGKHDLWVSDAYMAC